ncbi:prephenate dehydrogenase/arogenate dehydrogenase family protein [candidate division KSB1 bacterium]|nr:MAG: prephenate dehydrogenase/arogenate dehydrogenase family protein [candidate division KSB1 bacterium]
MAENVSESLDTLTLTSPLELMGSEFERVAIVGVGLIGGSIGLRMKSMDHAGIIVGHDKPDVLNEALERGAIDRGVGDLSEAVADMDLIVLATPVDETLKLLPTVLRMAKSGCLVTDTAAAKKEIFFTAQNVKDARAQYIGGHPLAGSDRQGIANADAALFDCAYWLLTPGVNITPAQRESLSWWVRLLGGYPVILNAELHDRIMAVTSHVPFVIALALSLWVARQSGEEPLMSKLATGTFRTMTGYAALPLDAWEAVIQANQADVEKALKEFAGILKECAADLHSGKLAEVWQQAYTMQRKLSRERPGDWDANCELVVTAQDRPGTIAQIAGLLAHHDIGIRDIHVIYVRERRGGTLAVVLASRAEARRAMEVLNMNGYSVRMKD